MSNYNMSISELAELSLRDIVFTYNVDAADTLQLELAPDAYAKLPFKPFDRLTVTMDGTTVFSGIVPMGANCAVQAAQGETVNIEFASDYYILDNTVYAQLSSSGEAVYVRTPVNSETTTLRAVVESISGWLGDRLPSMLVCGNNNYTVPTPSADGTAPCSSLLSATLRWVPGAVVYQRYSGRGGSINVAHYSGPPLSVSPANGNVVSASFRPRTDLQVRTCALVGGVHKVWPADGDVRDLGAFVYAVPVPQDVTENQAGAGEAPASSKMVVKGVAVPKPITFERSADEYTTTTITAMSDTENFIKRLLPEYAPLIPFMKAGTCLVNLVDKEQLQAELGDEDEDAQAPDNYMSEPEQWQNANMYVHVEGSFPASFRNSRNVKGLRWCKATLNLVLSVQANVSMPANIRALCQELMPGRLKQGGNSFYYVRKTLSCNVINRRRRVYDPATNKLCSNDPHYAEEQAPEDEQETSQTQLDYIAAMQAYYADASALQHEGVVELLYDGTVLPWAITGRMLTVDDMREDWSAMLSIVRSVTWNYNAGRISIASGPRATMGFSEQLERRVIARNRGKDESARNALRYDTRDTERQKEAEEEMSVSPSISAGTDTESSGVWHRPFTLFQREGDEDGTVVLAGGTLQRGSQQWNLDDSEEQYTNGQPNGTPWVLGRAVRLRWKKVGDTITFDIYQQ